VLFLAEFAGTLQALITRDRLEFLGKTAGAPCGAGSRCPNARMKKGSVDGDSSVCLGSLDPSPT
jgi:hypothetical protein